MFPGLRILRNDDLKLYIPCTIWSFEARRLGAWPGYPAFI